MAIENKKTPNLEQVKAEAQALLEEVQAMTAEEIDKRAEIIMETFKALGLRLKLGSELLTHTIPGVTILHVVESFMKRDLVMFVTLAGVDYYFNVGPNVLLDFQVTMNRLLEFLQSLIDHGEIADSALTGFAAAKELTDEGLKVAVGQEIEFAGIKVRAIRDQNPESYGLSGGRRSYQLKYDFHILQVDLGYGWVTLNHTEDDHWQHMTLSKENLERAAKLQSGVGNW